MIQKEAFLPAVMPAIKTIGSIAGKAFGPLFVAMDATSAAKKARIPFGNIGPAKNMVQSNLPQTGIF